MYFLLSRFKILIRVMLDPVSILGPLGMMWDYTLNGKQLQCIHVYIYYLPTAKYLGSFEETRHVEHVKL